jgi:hypothetical protein
VGNELGIGEMKKAGALVRENVRDARNEVVKWQVTMVALVEGVQAEEIGHGTRRGGGAFSLSCDGCCVVGQVVDCVGTDVTMLGQDVELRDGGCQLQFAVGDGAGWVRS